MTAAQDPQAALRAAHDAYEEFAQRGLDLDITRGKPAPEQLDLSAELLTAVTGDDVHSPSGVDARNYGGAEGLRELRELFAPLLGVPADQLLAQGNSSLTLMRDALTFALLFGTPAGGAPWVEGRRAMLCPVPGYDRHFGLAEALGFELISIPMDDEGPDLEAVRQAVADPAVKAMWTVPLYSNPTGVSMSERRARDLLALETAAPDFTILWDNAYGLHHLREPHAQPLDALGLAAEAGRPDRVWEFASTSKITFAGSGVAFFASSPANVDWFLEHTAAGSIGPDKLNQLRHLRFFGDPEAVRAHMERQAALIEPKFAAVERALADGLSEGSAASWTRPHGGYFITLRVAPGTADRVVKLASEAGVKLTPAGATHPYGLDPEDAYIRIAPTMPSLDDVRAAAEGLVACVRLAELEAAAAS
ncbi:aminotransferase [Brevibacterium sp. 5221]|uniref:Aminotransferase n=1 Tax=Brevibacterium rongguiense TaxID=2695267 RepID=A0A6N9HAS5_9MICO|nr:MULTISPECIES: aminotransferase class I/II-fold pyridoxal phosphate-dependent enzyme [Brevibacterium]MYM20831.1 aminotransferase [Brevibacterium rongguiense]WAL40757.1 aminotransferase [Brevibacterium sp. BRM-1]